VAVVIFTCLHCTFLCINILVYKQQSNAENANISFYRELKRFPNSSKRNSWNVQSWCPGRTVEKECKQPTCLEMVINLKNCLCYDCNVFRDEIRFYLSPEKHNFTIKSSNKLFPDTMQIHTTQAEGRKEEIHLKKQRVAN
jgi:hypothetical protein